MGLYLFLLYLWTISSLTKASSCRRELSYHDLYGYGYDIYCDQLGDSNIQELATMEAYKETVLTITRSNISALNSSLFGNLERLKEIIITDSKILIPANQTTFDSLPFLEKISLESCNLTKIERTAFKGATSIKAISLFSNNLDKIEKETFKDTPNILKLNLAKNKISDVGNVPFCDIKSLIELNLNNNSLKVLRDSSFKCLTDLQNLYLDNNKIFTLGNSLANVPNLIELSLSYNFIDKINLSFLNLTQLETLNLEGNKIKIINKQNMKTLNKLKMLNLKSNLLENVTADAFSDTRDISDLNLENNKLNEISLYHLLRLEYINLARNNFSENCLENFKDLFHLKTLILRRNSVNFLKDNAFQKLKTLEILDLSFNHVVLGNKSFSGLKYLTELYLNHNGLNNLNKSIFKDLNNLQILDLSNNKINTVSNETFTNLFKLEILNISYNKLEVLDNSVLTPLYSLKLLDLEGNFLKAIKYKLIINELQSLQTLNIKGNLLSCHFLGEMIAYFKSKGINYTINEHFKYDKENVEGIYCSETEARLNISLVETNQALEKNSKILNELYNITLDSNRVSDDKVNETILILGLVLTFILLFVLFVSYKGYFQYKRRNYIQDELELIGRNKM